MKVKPIYIYGAGIILAALVFIFLSQNEVSSPTVPAGDIAGKAMPQDSIHKALMNENGEAPGKDNVMATVTQHLEMLKKEVEKNPKDTLKIKQYADFLAAAHKSDEAITYYEKILKVNPKRTDVLYSVAYIYYLNRDFKNAEKTLNKVLSYDKNNLQVQYNLGAIAFGRGDKEKAKKIWTKIAEKNPNSNLGQLAKKSLTQL